MSLSQIKVALFDRLESLLPSMSGVTVHYPNVDSTLPTSSHIIPTILPATTTPVGIRATDRERGIFQVSIFVKAGSGELLAPNYAQIILNGFSRNLALNGVRIDRSGSIGPAIINDGWLMLPVSITYQSII